MARAVENQRETTLGFFLFVFFPKRRNAPWEESPLTVQVLPGDVANKTLIQTFDVHQSHEFSNSPLEPKITNIPHGRHWRNVVTKKTTHAKTLFFSWPVLPSQWLPARVLFIYYFVFYFGVDIVSGILSNTERFILTCFDTCLNNQILHLSATWNLPLNAAWRK